MNRPSYFLALAVAAALAAPAHAQDAEQEMAAKQAALAKRGQQAAASPRLAPPGIPVAGRSAEDILRDYRARPMAKRTISPKSILAYAGDTTGAPTWNRPSGIGVLSGVGTATPYVFSPFAVSSNDTCSINSVQAGWDGYIHVYENAFDPLDPLTNLVALDDDGFGGIGTSDITGLALTAGTQYFLVTTGFGNADFGTFTNTINCPVATVTSSNGVELTLAGSSFPVPVAQELIIPPSRTITNNGRLDLSTAIEYAFSPGEVRYARLHCPGVQFAPGTTVSFDGDPSNLVGAVNGVGSDAIYFSITAGATPVVASDRLTIDGDRVVTAEAAVDCTYGLYDFPSQAQAGGATGRVVQTSGAYLRFVPSTALRVNVEGNPVADVESPDPAYSEFVVQAPTFWSQSGQIGGFSVGTVQGVLGQPQPITLDGEPVEVNELWSLDTTLVVSGDFSASSLAYFSFDSDCSTLAEAFDSWDENGAYYAGWNFEVLDVFVCHLVGGLPIPAGEFEVSLQTDSADPATYEVPVLGPEFLGQITRNGTELQAPLAQVPENYLSRMVLTNTGSLDRPYEISVFGEDGNVISTDNLTGMVPAGGTIVVDLVDVLTGFTAAPRATLNVTVAAPNNTIQGLYQIVNPDSGTISNHVMVRPGTN